MSLDKAIASGKEHRKKYRGCKAIDATCRNHGSCPHCRGVNKYKTKKRIEKAEADYE
jgi:hypothetical protein